MSFYLARPYRKKPSGFVEPNLGHPILRDLTLWFPVLEPTGATIRDFSKYGHHGFLNSFEYGIQNRRAFFNNTHVQNGQISVPHTPALEGAANSPFTLSLWMHSFIGASYRGLIFKGNNSPYRYSMGTLSRDLAYFAPGGPGWQRSDRSWNVNEWWHLAAVYDGVNCGLYLNGQLDTTFALNPQESPDDLVVGGWTAGDYTVRGYLEDVRVYNRALSSSEMAMLADDAARWEPFERRIWIPPTEAAPPGPIQLNIDAIRHGRPVDDVDVVELITIVPIDINGLRHGRRVDSLTLGVSFDLFVSSMRHGRSVDAIALDVSVDLAISALRHGRAVDIVDLQELIGVVVDISDHRHGRPVDSLLLDVEQPILIDNLRHGRPVDVVGVQPLLGDQTGIGATASNWILDAGQALNNASSVDFDYHVIEGLFDSDQSVLGIDGSRVTGSAGMRELTALTLGANVDGQERVQGKIAELRIYAGALSQADRDRIVQELTTKWITG